MEQYVMLSVGQSWTLSKIPDSEGIIFEIFGSHPCLLLFFDHLTDEDIKKVNYGQLKMGYYFISPIIFIVCKIQDFSDWMDAPFSIRAYDDQELDFNLSEDFPQDEGMNINLFLIDRISQKLCAIRNFTTSHNFAAGFRHKCWEQLQEPFSMDLYQSVVSSAYMRLSPKDLGKRAENFFLLKGSVS